MISIAQKLDEKMKNWDPQKASSVEKIVNEIIDLADEDCLDLLRSRIVDQEVLDILYETWGDEKRHITGDFFHPGFVPQRFDGVAVRS